MHTSEDRYCHKVQVTKDQQQGYVVGMRYAHNEMLKLVWFVYCVLPRFQFEEVAARDDLMGLEDTAKKNILVSQVLKTDCEIVDKRLWDVV